jgi:hypothetical protein
MHDNTDAEMYCNSAIIRDLIDSGSSSLTLSCNSIVDAVMDQYKLSSEEDKVIMTDDELNEQIENFQKIVSNFNSTTSFNTNNSCRTVSDDEDEECMVERSSEFHYLDDEDVFEPEQSSHDADVIIESAVETEELSATTALICENTAKSDIIDVVDNGDVVCADAVLLQLESSDESAVKSLGENGDETSLSERRLSVGTMKTLGLEREEDSNTTPLGSLSTSDAGLESTISPCPQSQVQTVAASAQHTEDSFVEVEVRSVDSTSEAIEKTQSAVLQTGLVTLESGETESLKCVVNEAASNAGFETVKLPMPSLLSTGVLSAQPSSSSSPRPRERPMISFLDFQSGDIALFLPMDAQTRDVWSAFNSMRQHHYLSEQSMNVFLPRGAAREHRVFVLGRIVMMDSHVASGRFNPYRLPAGTQFHVCHVEPLNKCRQQYTRSTPSSSSSVVVQANNSGGDGNSIQCESRACIPRIAFTEFHSGELALFLLGNKQRGIWMAFHSNRPYHFLSDVSRFRVC